MAALLVRHVAPGLVAGLAGTRNQLGAPQLASGQRIVRRDDAGLGAAGRHAAAAGDHPAARDDGTRRLVGRVHLVVEDLRLPDPASGDGVQREDVVVRAGVDDEPVVDGDVAVRRRADRDVLREVVRLRAAMLPEQVAADGVDGLDDVARVRHVHDAVVDQGRSLLAALREGAGPDQPQVGHVLAVHLLEGAVAPAVGRPAPAQPVARGRLLQHRVRDRDEVVARLGNGGRREVQRQRDHDEPPAGRHASPSPGLELGKLRQYTSERGVCSRRAAAAAGVNSDGGRQNRRNWRRRPDLNRGWRFCRPLPYHLATAPLGENRRREERMERETGFEPATSTLARSHSTTELFPLAPQPAPGRGAHCPPPDSVPCGQHRIKPAG